MSMSRIQKSIEVDVPVTTAYNQWTQFEEFPLFMEGVEEIQQLDDSRLRWVAHIGGKRKEWYAKIINQSPDKEITWKSEEGTWTAGRVAFEPIGLEKTQITLEMGYDTESALETAGDKLGFLERRVQGDLNRFKEFIEARGTETGAWRGEIPEGSSTPR